jgi:hypothetical protein
VSTKPTSLSERAQDSFSKLKSVASDLNQVSDEISEPISRVEKALNELKLGVPTWISISRMSDEAGEFFEHHDLGYAKTNGKWGIALRITSGQLGIEHDSKEWLFDAAPRSLRLEGIEYLPALLEKMSADAAETVRRVRASLDVAKELATAISGKRPTVDLMAALKSSLEQQRKTGGRQ